MKNLKSFDGLNEAKISQPKYSFFITKEKLSNKQLNDIAREIYPD